MWDYLCRGITSLCDNLRYVYITEYQEPENPVWTIDQPVIRLDLRVGIKKEN